LKENHFGDPEVFEYFQQVTQTSGECENATRCVRGRLDRIVVRGAPNLKVEIHESFLDPDFILRAAEGNPIDESGAVIVLRADGKPLDPDQKFVDPSDHKPRAAVVDWTLYAD
jgi:hypothetical protein